MFTTSEFDSSDTETGLLQEGKSNDLNERVVYPSPEGDASITKFIKKLGTQNSRKYAML